VDKDYDRHPPGGPSCRVKPILHPSTKSVSR